MSLYTWNCEGNRGVSCVCLHVATTSLVPRVCHSVTSNEGKASCNSSDATPKTRGLRRVHVPLGLPDPWQAKRKSYNAIITAVSKFSS